MALNGRFIALCLGEIYLENCKSHYNGGLKLALSNRIVVLYYREIYLKNCIELQILL